MRDDGPLVQIDDQGSMTVPAELTEQLATTPGTYRLLPPTANLIILQRSGAAKKEKGRVILSGAIERAGGLVDVLQLIHGNQWTGRLSVFSGTTLKTIHFRRGEITAATSNVPEDRVGAILYRYGMITESVLDSALKSCGPTTRLGQMLVKDKVISAHDLFSYMRKQVEEIFFSTLTMPDGSFSFFRLLNDADALPSQLKIPTHELLLQGVSRIDELSYFREKLPSPDLALFRRQPAPSKALAEKEKTVLDLVDGVRTVAEITRLSRLGELDATKIIVQLISGGYMQPQTKAQANEELISTYNRVFAKIFAAVAGRDKAASLVTGVSAFLASEDESGPLFRDVQLETDGTISAKKMLANLGAQPVPAEAQHEFLRHALTELSFFELFFAGEAIGFSDVAFHEELNRISAALKR